MSNDISITHIDEISKKSSRMIFEVWDIGEFGNDSFNEIYLLLI